MGRRNCLLLLVLAASAIVACGPDTIFLRPALDTPEHHVKNGHSLLSRGKIDAANAEFKRAKALDAGYAPAYVIAVVVRLDRARHRYAQIIGLLLGQPWSALPPAARCSRATSSSSFLGRV
jgi:hypothetical protein